MKKRKRTVKRLLSMLLVLMMAAGVLAGCGSTGSTESDSSSTTDSGIKTGGTVTFGLSTEPYTLDPMIGAGYASKNICCAIYEGLFKYDEDGNVTNAICESYEVSDDGTVYTFYLTDADFSNGDPVTAEDVQYTFERIMETDSGAYYCTLLNNHIESIEVIDDKTCEVTLNAAFAAFIEYLATKELLIVSKSWTEAHDGDISQDPMGAGAFKFVSWDSGVGITLEANENYYIEGQPYLDGVEFVFYSDENARVNALLTDAVDIIEYTPQSQFDTINAEDDLVVYEQNGPVSYLVMNTENEYLSNKLVRQAIAYAINKEDVLTAAFSGKGTILNGSPLLESSLGYTEEAATVYEQNIEKAKELLEEAGYPDGFDITILTSSTYSFMEQTAVVIQSCLKEIGIDAEIESVEWSTFNQRSNSGDCELATQAFLGDVNDPDWLNTLYAEGGGYNMAAYQSDEYDELGGRRGGN